MKRRLTFMIALMLMLVLMLSSCVSVYFLSQLAGSEKVETAEQALEKISETMSSVFSFRQERTVDITASVASNELRIVGNGLIVAMYGIDRMSYYYDEDEMIMGYGGEDISVKTTLTFDDGKLFFVGREGKEEKRFYSTCTNAEFNDFFENASKSGSSITEGYSNGSLTETTSGGYNVILKNYDEETINTLNAAYGFPYEENGGKITDITVTMTTDSSLLLNQIAVDFSFSDASFSGRQTLVYSQYNSARKITDIIPLESYTEVGDVRAIMLYSSLISQEQSKDSNSFLFSMTQRVTAAGNTTQNVEIDEVRFGNENGSYYFSIKSDIDGQKSNATYRDGEYRINGVLESGDYSDYEAKAFIDGLIEPFSISFLDVGTVISSPTEKGTLYTFKIDSLDMQFYLKELIESANMHYIRATMTVEMLVKDYELVSLRYIIDGQGSISVSSSVRYDATLKFDVTVSYDSSKPDL